MTAPAGTSLPPLQGLPVLVYSLGIEGRDLARWLVAHGARVTISDTRSEAELAAAGAAPPEGVERVVTGQPLLDPAGFGLVAVSQSILRYNPALARARELGIPITSQMRLFLQLCPGRTIGITGSSGKSTTTALVGAMAREAGIEFVLGGNIGEPLLARLDEIRSSTTVILEISHTQLQYTDRSPHIAAVTNVTPNHLDQFSWDEYVGLKRNHIAHQSRDDVAVLSHDNPVTRAFMASVRGRLVAASIEAPLQLDGAFIDGGEIVVRRASRVTPVVPVAEVRLRGRHNLANAVMACAIAAEAGWPVTAMARAIRTFAGVPHRLEVVGRAGGATWVNDSIATSPERTVAGLRAFDEPVVEEPAAPGVLERYGQELNEILRVVTVLVLGGMAFFLLGRPLVRRVAVATPVEPAALPAQLPRTIADLEGEIEAQLEAQALSKVPDRRLPVLTKRLSAAAQREPEAAARLVRTWLLEDKQ
ncbi:MAG: UDP-N-acetylmuramoyl-L-alanine--D-glutamate ligase [Candidatus Rokubacteria bacterium]|nr:UDP-N-acetylmuramoyl-L-alanine--D-glutamate ligase [Candidatus Rokubacteria bacterium]